VSDFDDLMRWAIDSQLTVGTVDLITKVRELPLETRGDVEPVPPLAMLEPALFLKVCAPLVETADRFEAKYEHEEVALYELVPRLRSESLPTIWRCYDAHTVEGELLVLGRPFWKRYNVASLRTMLQRFREQKLTGLGATPEGRPLKVCGVFTDQQRLDAMCPLQSAAVGGNSILKTGKIDWDDWWEHESYRRHENSLPNEKSYLAEAEVVIRYRYGVTSVSDSELRRFKAALYSGKTERPKQTRKRAILPD
jgi:hypothetical protein